MKSILFLLAAILSTSAFAHERCHYRFNPNLAVDVVVNNRMGNDMRGSISWDDANTCSADGEICTEIYPGTFKVRFKDLTPPDTQGATTFRIKAINKRDDLGNRYLRFSKFGSFVRGAVFMSVVIPEPNLTFFWRGKEYEMKCTEVVPHTFGE